MPYPKSKKVLIYLILFVIIGTLNNKNLKNINFAKVNEIQVTGLDEKNHFEIIKNLDSVNISNIFLLRKTQIKDVINSNNLVEKYSVFKLYPSALIIKIDKTKFLAQIKKNDDNFILGSNGKFIKSIDFRDDIPFIFGDFNNNNFFELKKAIDESNFNYKQIKNLFFFKSGRWDIETNNGLLIKLPENDIKESLQFINNFLTEKNDKEIYKIDLRQKNQIIING